MAVHINKQGRTCGHAKRVKYFWAQVSPTTCDRTDVLDHAKAGLRPPTRKARGSLRLGHRYAASGLVALCARRCRIVWVGTDSGLALYDRYTGNFFPVVNNPNDENTLSENLVQAIVEDQSGGLWIGTSGGGLNRFDPQSERFAHYRSNPNNDYSLNVDEVTAIYEAREDILWIGTEGGGLNRYDWNLHRWRSYLNNPEEANSISDNDVTAIYQDQEGFYWIGTAGGGLNRFDRPTETFIHYRYESGNPRSLSSDTIRAIYEDSNGNLWIGTASGLNRFNRRADNFIRYVNEPTNPNSLSDNTIAAIFQDNDGYLWVSTHAGLNRFNIITEQIRHYYHDPDDPGSISHDIVLCFYQDRSGIIWMGTWGGGLNRFDPDDETFKRYRVQDGLPNDVIYGILGDNQGNLWMSTNNGISRFDPVEEAFQNYQSNDGLQSNEFNVGSFFRNQRGEMYFGGINGFNKFNPQEIVDNPFKPPIVLTSLSLTGRPIEDGRGLETLNQINLNWPDNSFEVEFAALSYYQPQKNQYAYKLKGYDQAWNQVGVRRFARYTNLSGGQYSLKIIGSNSEGVWNEKGIAIEVRVMPPFWAQGWFVGLGILLLGSIAYGAYRLRIYSMESRSRQLSKLVDERTHEIERRRLELEALYRADEELHRTLDLDKVLQALVDTAVNILGADKGSLMVWDAEHHKMTIRAMYGFDPLTVGKVTFSLGEGVAGQVALTGRPAMVEDTLANPQVTRAITDPENIRAFMQVPIEIGGKTFGVFSADYTQPRNFSEDEMRLLVALAQRAALAIQNAQLFEQAQELAAVQERTRLARDLHDAVTQTLFSISLIAEVLPAVWEMKQEEGRQQLEEVRLLARGALAEMRSLLLELRPEELARAKMADLLNQLARVTTGRSGVIVQVEAEQDCTLPAMVQIAFYRIAQEALNNAGKHAKAGKIEVYFTCQLDQARLIVKDNGRGFDKNAIPSGHFGLEIMEERAALIGGNLSILTQPGQGSVITLEWQENNEEPIDE